MRALLVVDERHMDMAGGERWEGHVLRLRYRIAGACRVERTLVDDAEEGSPVSQARRILRDAHATFRGQVRDVRLEVLPLLASAPELPAEVA